MNKKASVPVVVFVLGVFVVCIFALIVFMTSFTREENFIFDGLESFYGLDYVKEDIRLHLDMGKNLQEAVEDVGKRYSDFDIDIKGESIVVKRIIVKKTGFFFGKEKEVFSIERKINFNHENI